MKIRAFSLIELLVVITIIGVLAAIAIPAYKTYAGRATLNSSIATLESIMGQIKIYYDSHNANFLNTALHAPIENSTSTPNIGNIVNTRLWHTEGNYNGSGIVLYAQISGLSGMGIPNYQEPIPGDFLFDKPNQVALFVYNFNNGQGTKIICGYMPGLGIPPEYLPNNCQCNVDDCFRHQICDEC